MLLSRFQRVGTAQCTKPVFFFATIALTISLVFTTFLITGCTTSAPGLRKFYTISLSYKAGNDFSKITNELSSISSDVKSFFSKNEHNSTSKSNITLSTVRVGYRGVCAETSDSKWTCSSNSTQLSAVNGDPLDLVGIGELYRQKISFTLPLWAALAFIAVAWLAVVANSIPVIPIPPVTRKVAASASAIGVLFLLGALVLQQVTDGAVSALIDKLGMGIVDGHAGRAVQGFGWAAFALTLAASIGICALVAAEMAVERARMRAEALMGAGLNKATGGRVGVEDVEMLRGFKASATAEGGFGQGGFGKGPAKPKQAMSLASKLLSLKR